MYTNNTKHSRCVESSEANESVHPDDKLISINDLHSSIVEGAFMDAIDLAYDYTLYKCVQFTGPNRYAQWTITLKLRPNPNVSFDDNNNLLYDLTYAINNNKYKIEAAGYKVETITERQYGQYVKAIIYSDNECDMYTNNTKHSRHVESFFGLFKSKAEKDNELISIKDLTNDVIEGAFMDAIDICDDYTILDEKYTFEYGKPIRAGVSAIPSRTIFKTAYKVKKVIFWIGNESNNNITKYNSGDDIRKCMSNSENLRNFNKSINDNIHKITSMGYKYKVENVEDVFFYKGKERFKVYLIIYTGNKIDEII